jgi:hypothetical protein
VIEVNNARISATPMPGRSGRLVVVRVVARLACHSATLAVVRLTCVAVVFGRSMVVPTAAHAHTVGLAAAVHGEHRNQRAADQ